MGEQFAKWYNEQGEYLTGALFGLITLDIFMFLLHCITQGTTDGYGLTGMLILISIGAVAATEKLYHSQAETH